MKNKTISLRLYKKHLDGAFYSDPYDCPIARAMTDRGYTNVLVGATRLKGVKNGERVFFEILHGGGMSVRIQPAMESLTPLTVKIQQVSAARYDEMDYWCLILSNPEAAQ